MEGEALAGHMDMIPRTWATLSRGRKGETGVRRQQVCVRSGWGSQRGLPGSHFLFLS